MMPVAVSLFLCCDAVKLPVLLEWLDWLGIEHLLRCVGGGEALFQRLLLHLLSTPYLLIAVVGSASACNQCITDRRRDALLDLAIVWTSEEAGWQK